MTGVSDTSITLYLVRHGKAAAAWHESRDPGLDPVGQDQAKWLAEELDRSVEAPMALLSSPLMRARETVEPLARLWRRQPEQEPRVAEVPSPGMALDERGRWLQGLFRSRWPDLGANLWDWREQALQALCDCRQNTVVVTHAVLINAVVSGVTRDERVLVFRPDYCSVTKLTLAHGKLALEALGREAETHVG